MRLLTFRSRTSRGRRGSRKSDHVGNGTTRVHVVRVSTKLLLEHIRRHLKARCARENVGIINNGERGQRVMCSHSINVTGGKGGREEKKRVARSCNRNDREESYKYLYKSCAMKKKIRDVGREETYTLVNPIIRPFLALFMDFAIWWASYYLWTYAYFSSGAIANSSRPGLPVVYVPSRTSSRAKLRLRARSGG